MQKIKIFFFNQFFKKPWMVFFTLLFIFSSTLIFDGTLFRWIFLFQKSKEIEQHTQQIRDKVTALDSASLHTPEFFEQEIKRNLPFYRQSDLLFIFLDKTDDTNQ